MTGGLMFSIVIPVYKVEKYIRACVESVLHQNFSDCEIVLVDDGSPDGCPLICDELARHNCQIKVIHKENGGVSAARRDGARAAKGEYVVFIDGDDWLDRECLKLIADVTRKTNADIVCYGMVYDNGKSFEARTLEYRPGYYSHEDIERELFPSLIQGADVRYFAPSLCGKAIRRRLFIENCLVDRRVVIGEDGACVIPCVYHAKSMYILKECMYHYRYNVESATRRERIYNWEWPRLVAEHITRRIDIQKGNFREQLDRKITHDLFTVVLSQFNRQDSYDSIIRFPFK